MGLESVAITTVWVKDVDRALDFYTGTLGLEKGMDEEFDSHPARPGGPGRPDDRNRGQ
jgi:catechol 2,3-dioxygenase-like lactoylglutathione lyase family enzyme